MVKPLFLAVVVEAASGVVVQECQNYYREGYRTVTGVITRQFC
jgi:hypothetical protein